MKLTNMILCGAVASLGMVGLNASALPSGFESVKIKATLLVAGEDTVTKVKVTNKDILSQIIEPEFGSIATTNGAQLVSYGVDDEEFAVLDKHGNVLISDASSDEDSYHFYLEVYEWDELVLDEKGNTDNWTESGSYITYQSDDEESSLTLTGLMTDKVDYDKESESYKMSGSGSFDFGGGEEEGVVTGGISGSGKEVDVFDP